MTGLTEKEALVAREIIAKGLEKAAESLTFFMNEPITLKDFGNDELLENPPVELNKKSEDKNIILLTTKVIGELKGVCCLVFSEEEADHLRKASLPPESLNSPEMMAEMSQVEGEKERRQNRARNKKQVVIEENNVFFVRSIDGQ